MISVMDGSASSASSGPSPSTSARPESTRRSLSFLVMVIAVVRKYSSASSTIFSRTPDLLLESISSAYFSISRAWCCTLAAAKAGVSSPPPAGAARAASEGAGAPVTAGEVRATGIAVAELYVEAAPGTVPTAGPLVDPTVPGGTVWFCLTLSSRPISAIDGRHRFVKWYLFSTSFWLTPWADWTCGQPSSDALGCVVRLYLRVVLLRNQVKSSASHWVSSIVRLETIPPTGPDVPAVVAPPAGWTFTVRGPRPITRTCVNTVLLTIFGGPAGAAAPVAKTVRLADEMTVM